jgi:hypothetical protein
MIRQLAVLGTVALAAKVALAQKAAPAGAAGAQQRQRACT